jgi:hypothetical protein
MFLVIVVYTHPFNADVGCIKHSLPSSIADSGWKIDWILSTEREPYTEYPKAFL